MKKSLLALAALTAFAGVASAQSSVTLFGIVDLSARSVKNGSAGSLKSLSTNGNASSRLGFRGVEDLGGGLRAGFWIEGDISADVGGGIKTAANANGSAADPMNWARRSTVSLIGNFGEIRLGRDYTPTFSSVAAFDPWGYVGVATLANVRSSIGSGATTGVRASNAISYFLPAMGGLYGQVQVAAGENSTGNKYVGGRLGYAAGPVNTSFAYGKTYKTGVMTDDLIQYSAGVSFNAGFATFQGVFEKSDYAANNQKLAGVNVLVPLGSGTLKASFVKTSGSVAYAAKQYGVGYVYDLSKRTSMYAQYGSINNDGNNVNGAQFASSSGGPVAGYRRGESSSGYEFGVRHNF